MEQRLRASNEADDALLRRIYRDTREAELALTNWDDAEREAFVRMQFEAQRQHYRLHYPGSVESLIQRREHDQWIDVGRLWLDDRGHTLHLLDIAVLARWRARGIGTRALRDTLARAAARGCAVSIHVETGNPARRLYERLGFVAVGDPEGVHQRMVWRASAPQLQEVCDEKA